MILSDRYTLDPDKIKFGVERQIGDAFITLSYFNSSMVEMHFAAKTKIYSQLGLSLSDATLKALHETLVELVILGWRNLKEKDEDGVITEIPYSKENATMVLAKYPKFDIDIINQSSVLECFKKEIRKEVEEK